MLSSYRTKSLGNTQNDADDHPVHISSRTDRRKSVNTDQPSNYSTVNN